MNYEIIGDSDNPLLKVKLSRGEMIKLERGAMVYMSDVEIKGKMNSKGSGIGGMFSAIGRGLTSGESMFVTEATGTADDGEIGIAPSVPGKIIPLSTECWKGIFWGNWRFVCYGDRGKW